MAIPESAGVRLVSQRSDKYPARSHHLHHIRMEREDQAAAVKAIRLSGSRSILEKFDTQRLP